MIIENLITGSLTVLVRLEKLFFSLLYKYFNNHFSIYVRLYERRLFS